MIGERAGLVAGLPDLPDVVASAVVVRVPLAVRFRGVAERECVLLQGPYGWAEFGPFLEYGDDEAAWWLAAALEQAWAEPLDPQRAQVEVNATVPAVPAAEVAQVLARYDGCATVKVKVAEAGQTVADDVARVRAVRELAGQDVAIRVDANGGWSVAAAHRALSQLAELGLDYAEQPCAGVDELVELREVLRRNGMRVQVAADESIRKADDPLAVARTGAIDVAVVKVAPLGGVRRVLALADELSRLGVRVVVSSALETSVGLAGGVRAAACLPGEPEASGLGTARLLADDVTDDPLVPQGGRLPVRPVVPSDAALQRLSVTPERRSFWIARLRRTHATLTGQR